MRERNIDAFGVFDLSAARAGDEADRAAHGDAVIFAGTNLTAGQHFFAADDKPVRCGHAVPADGVDHIRSGADAVALGEAAVSALNQAQVLTDGQQIRVPTQEEIELQPELAAGQEESGIGPEPDGRVNINTADAQELMTLSGIGEARAQAIIAYREEQGGFASPEQIMEVSGIGEGIYSRIEDQIAVE